MRADSISPLPSTARLVRDMTCSIITGLAGLLEACLRCRWVRGVVYALLKSSGIYEAAFVKPPVQGIRGGSPRTFPLAVGVGRSAHFSRGPR